MSACVIALNEERRLPRALASLRFCDEVIVIDGGSRDRTVELARAAGAKVIEHPWEGFAAQRNFALDAASSDWILEVDADEQISPALRASIEAFLAAPPAGTAMCVCSLRNRFLGAFLGPSAKYPAYRSRLFRRSVYRHREDRVVHEGIDPRERPLVLDGDLEHELAGTLREALADTWRYARLESEHIGPARDAGAYVKGIVLRPAAKLAYRTFIDEGWRDGWRGLLKISLDVTSDVLVWMLVLGRRAGAGARVPGEQAPKADGARARQHFGRRGIGPAKVVAIAGSSRAALDAERWLQGLRDRGLDVMLISSGQRDGRAIHGTALHSLSPFSLMRALDVEAQLRSIDAVVPVGGRARLVSRLLPGSLRPVIPGLSADLDPERAAALAQEAVRARG